MRRLTLVAVFVLVAAFIGWLAPDALASGASTAHLRPDVTSVAPTAGPTSGGTKLTIRGRGFSAVESVTIGGKKARDVRVRSASLLTVVAPAHLAGGARVTVTEKSGVSPASAVRYHYLSRPVLTGLSAHSGPVTGGQLIVISGRGFSYLTAVTFGALRATVLPGSTATRLRVRTPPSWAGLTQVAVRTPGGTTARSAPGRFSFQNPPAARSGQVTPATGDTVASGADVTAVSGGLAQGGSQAPWTVTLAPTVPVPGIGEKYLLRPGGAVYPTGLAGTVTAVDDATGVITVKPELAATVTSAQALFTGPLGSADATGTSGDTTARPAGGSLTNTVSFPPIPASALQCVSANGVSVSVSGSASLTLDDVEAHFQVDAGSSWDDPYVDVWLSYQPVLSVSLTASASATCSLPDEWQEAHQKLFLLGDSGATITIAPAASFTVSASGSVTLTQHSYRIIGFATDPDGSISRIDSQSSDPAQVTASAAITAEAAAGVQVQFGELDVIGVGMTIEGGVSGTASSPWPPQVCLSVTPFLRATVYAYLNAWVQEWEFEQFSAEVDLSLIDTCSGLGWHLAWQGRAGGGGVDQLTCPTVAVCYAVGGAPGRSNGYGYLLRTSDGGQQWQATTMTDYDQLYSVACVNATHCVAGGNGDKVAVTSNGGASWSQVTLPYYVEVANVEALACLPGGTCYATAYMTKYSGELVYASSNDGESWRLMSSLDDEPAAMTCLSGAWCLAAGAVPQTQMGIVSPAATVATRTGWSSSYTGAGIPSGWDSLTNVACLSTSLCYASGTDLSSADGGEDVLVSGNFGKTWQSVSADGLLAWSVSCAPGAMCVVGGDALDGSQYVIETVDGRTWAKSTISSFPAADQMDTSALSCPSLGHCVAIEGSLNPNGRTGGIFVS